MACAAAVVPAASVSVMTNREHPACGTRQRSSACGAHAAEVPRRAVYCAGPGSGQTGVGAWGHCCPPDAAQLSRMLCRPRCRLASPSALIPRRRPFSRCRALPRALRAEGEQLSACAVGAAVLCEPWLAPPWAGRLASAACAWWACRRACFGLLQPLEAVQLSAPGKPRLLLRAGLPGCAGGACCGLCAVASAASLARLQQSRGGREEPAGLGCAGLADCGAAAAVVRMRPPQQEGMDGSEGSSELRMGPSQQGDVSSAGNCGQLADAQEQLTLSQPASARWLPCASSSRGLTCEGRRRRQRQQGCGVQSWRALTCCSCWGGKPAGDPAPPPAAAAPACAAPGGADARCGQACMPCSVRCRLALASWQLWAGTLRNWRARLGHPLTSLSRNPRTEPGSGACAHLVTSCAAALGSEPRAARPSSSWEASEAAAQASPSGSVEALLGTRTTRRQMGMLLRSCPAPRTGPAHQPSLTGSRQRA